MTLKEQLEALVPEPTADFTVGARTYSRKARRRRVAGTAALATAVIAVGVPMALRGDQGSQVADSPDLPSIECPAGQEQPAPGPEPVRARLCAPGSPSDTLRDVDELLSLVETAAVADPACAEPDRDSWAIVFQNSDGSTGTVRGLPSCGLLMVGPSTRQDTGELLPRFYSLLAEQRAGQEPPGSEGDVSCRQQGLSTPLVGTKVALTKAFACRTEGGDTAQNPLTGEQVELINADFNANAEKMTMMPSCIPEPVGYSIVGTNAWGDTIVMSGYCLGFMVGEMTWQPGPAVEAMFPK